MATNFKPIPISQPPEKLCEDYIVISPDGKLLKGFIDIRSNWFYSGTNWHQNPATDITHYLLPVPDSIILTREKLLEVISSSMANALKDDWKTPEQWLEVIIKRLANG